jgi:hypothetical protein
MKLSGLSCCWCLCGALATPQLDSVHLSGISTDRNIDRLMRCAKEDRVQQVMEPYLKALL